jgi:GDP-4-dehydro-6-deoxy-D-mannose reductase
VRTLLVTGHKGFVGRTFSAMLEGDPGAFDWTLVKLPDDCDIRRIELEAHIRRIAPDGVIHLAGLTSVAECFQVPDRCFDVNFFGTWNLLNALRATHFSGRLVFVSSGDCYGAIAPAQLPVSEDHPLRPRNPYAVSKVAAEALCYQWSQTERFEIVVARSFNHIGPGQDTRFAVASFASQIAAIRAHLAPPHITTGDLGVTRDLTDVRDVVRAYLALLARGHSGEAYNVGSGRETRLADVLDQLIELAGVEVEKRIDPARLRSDEQRRARADVRKIARDTGWSAATPLATTLADMLDDWTHRIAS